LYPKKLLTASINKEYWKDTRPVIDFLALFRNYFFKPFENLIFFINNLTFLSI